VIVEQLRIFKANREFRKRDEISQAVTENAADMIALVDVKGRRLYHSPAYKRVLGYSPSELSETSSFEQIHPDDRMRVLEAAREARESGVGRQLEYRIKQQRRKLARAGIGSQHDSRCQRRSGQAGDREP
jgi:PAS domain S-box-containing protein